QCRKLQQPECSFHVRFLRRDFVVARAAQDPAIGGQAELLMQTAAPAGQALSPAPASRLGQSPGAAVRNAALDSYRGLVMLLMMAETLHLSRVAHAFPASRFWSYFAYHQTHVDWAGCSLHDTIQPGFSFLVGAALPYSIAARLAKGGSFRGISLHALWRSLLLIALGIFLRSLNRPQTYFTFEDTLTQ